MRWRVGRTLGRTLYFDDVCVGMVDRPEMAKAIVVAMNGQCLDKEIADAERTFDELEAVRARPAARPLSANPRTEAWKGVAEDGSVGFDLLHGRRSLGAVTFASDGDVEILITKTSAGTGFTVGAKRVGRAGDAPDVQRPDVTPSDRPPPGDTTVSGHVPSAERQRCRRCGVRMTVGEPEPSPCHTAFGHEWYLDPQPSSAEPGPGLDWAETAVAWLDKHRLDKPGNGLRRSLTALLDSVATRARHHLRQRPETAVPDFTAGVAACVKRLELYAAECRYQALRVIEEETAFADDVEDQAEELNLQGAHIERAANMIRGVTMPEKGTVGP